MAARKSNKEQKLVHIFARYALNNGLIAFRTYTDDGHKNCVTLRKDGSWACMRDDEECKGFKYSKDHTCCHIERCKWYEQVNHPTPAPEKQAEAKAATNDLLARIEAEVQEHIEAEMAAAPQEKSEQARIADIDDVHEDRDESNEDARLDRWTDQALIEHAALNGNRKLQAPAGNASLIEKRLASCGCMK
jgi:hypothetical protein